MGRDFPRIQILTIDELLSGERAEVPYQVSTIKMAERVKPQNLGMNYEDEEE